MIHLQSERQAGEREKEGCSPDEGEVFLPHPGSIFLTVVCGSWAQAGSHLLHCKLLFPTSRSAVKSHTGYLAIGCRWEYLHPKKAEDATNPGPFLWRTIFTKMVLHSCFLLWASQTLPFKPNACPLTAESLPEPVPRKTLSTSD